jgi:hypothetical protein
MKKKAVIFLSCAVALFLISAILSSARAVPEQLLFSEDEDSSDLQVDTNSYGGIFNAENPENYLLNEVIKIIQDNPIVNFLDSVFVKLESIGVFRALFGVNWESKTALSFSILLSVILWVFFLFYIRRQFFNFFGVSKSYCYLYSLAFVLIFAHLQILIFLSKKIIDVSTSIKSEVWTGIALSVLLFGLIIIDLFCGTIRIKRNKRILNDKLRRIDTGAKISDAMAGGRNLSKKEMEQRIMEAKAGAKLNISAGEMVLREAEKRG